MVSQIAKELILVLKDLWYFPIQGSILDASYKIKGFNIIKFEDIGIVEPALGSC